MINYYLQDLERSRRDLNNSNNETRRLAAEVEKLKNDHIKELNNAKQISEKAIQRIKMDKDTEKQVALDRQLKSVKVY